MKVVVVLSGGMDSATVLGMAVKEIGAENVKTLTFNYGSKHNAKENECAKILSDFYGVENKLIQMPFINDLFKSDLLTSGGEVPEGHYAEENMKKTVVPFRNGIMLAIAAGFAESIGAQAVVIGNHSGDHAIYPDCRNEFMEHFSKAIETGTWANVTIGRPFESMTKGEIVALGIEIGVPYQHTWTCYKGLQIHCGKCGSCVERLDAFDFAKAEDPVRYEDRKSYKDVLERGPK
jgi:7-cyano-7-deazaguanine synthase